MTESLVFVAAAAGKELRRHLRSPTELLVWIGVPLLIGGLVILAAGGRSGPDPKARVLLVDHDSSFVSGALAGALGRSGVVEVEDAGDEVIARARLEGGEATAMLVVPEGFGDAVLTERPTTLSLVTNPAQRILPGIVEELLDVLRDAVFYLHRVAGNELKTLAGGPLEGEITFADERIADVSRSLNTSVRRLAPLLDPLAIELVVEGPPAEESEDGEEAGSGLASAFLSGILFMGLLFMAQGAGDELWREREERTLRRLLSSPHGAGALLAGKMLAMGLLMAVVAAVALAIGVAWLELPWRIVPPALLWATLSGTMLLPLFLLVHVSAGSRRGGNILTMVLLFPLMMIGGSFFPFEAMPAWMAAAGRATPNGWAVARLVRIVQGTAPAGEIAGGIGLILLLTLAFSVPLVLRVRGGFARSS